MIDFEELKGVIATDQTRCFPITSPMGHLARVRKNVLPTKETEPTVDELMNEEEKDP